MVMIDLNKKAIEIFEQNKEMGWWDDMNRCIYQTIQLINTEIAEATEGARNSLMDDHLPHRKMEEVELADVLIRTLDLGGRCGWFLNDDYLSEKAIKGAASQISKSGHTAARQHLDMCSLTCMLSDSLTLGDEYGSKNQETESYYTMLCLLVLSYGESCGYDIISAMNEKIEYNKNRSDHKRENRQGKEGQKSF